MTTAVQISDKLLHEAMLLSAVGNRSVTGQIEHWAKIGKCAQQNPGLTYGLIKEILVGIEELDQGGILRAPVRLRGLVHRLGHFSSHQI